MMRLKSPGRSVDDVAMPTLQVIALGAWRVSCAFMQLLPPTVLLEGFRLPLPFSDDYNRSDGRRCIRVQVPSAAAFIASTSRPRMGALELPRSDVRGERRADQCAAGEAMVTSQNNQ